MYRILHVSYLSIKSGRMMLDLIKLSFVWTVVPRLQDLMCDLNLELIIETHCTIFPSDSVGQNPPANAGDAGDTGSIPGSGRFPWRRKRRLALLFLPGESHGQRSLVGFHPWGLKESDSIEGLRRQAGSEQPFRKPCPQALPSIRAKPVFQDPGFMCRKGWGPLPLDIQVRGCVL